MKVLFCELFSDVKCGGSLSKIHGSGDGAAVVAGNDDGMEFHSGGREKLNFKVWRCMLVAGWGGVAELYLVSCLDDEAIEPGEYYAHVYGMVWVRVAK